MLLYMMYSGIFLPSQAIAYNSLVTIPPHPTPPHPAPLIIHILFSINTPEIESVPVAQMGASETVHSYTQ